MPATDQQPAWYPSINLDGDTTGTIRAAADAAAAIVAEMRANAAPRWLTLTGLQGTGKTMLARQIFAEAQPLNPGAAPLWIGDRRRGQRNGKCLLCFSPVLCLPLFFPTAKLLRFFRLRFLVGREMLA